MPHNNQALRQLARQHDYERYLCSLFAPKATRPYIWATLVLADELLRIPGSVSDPMVGLVRLKWWQEQLEACTKNDTTHHEHHAIKVLAPLIHSQILPYDVCRTLCEALAELMVEHNTTDLHSASVTTSVTLAAIYEMLAYCNGEASLVERYAALGHTHASIATIRTITKRESSMQPVTALISALPAQLPPAPKHHRFLQKLTMLDSLWIKRIRHAEKNNAIEELHNLPMLPLKLLLL